MNKVMGGIPWHVLLEHPKCGRTWLRYMINLAEASHYNVPLRYTLSGSGFHRQQKGQLGEYALLVAYFFVILGIMFAVQQYAS